ncbi:hypothetical protein Tco_0084512 [Tanacetum coccineum]
MRRGERVSGMGSKAGRRENGSIGSCLDPEEEARLEERGKGKVSNKEQYCQARNSREEVCRKESRRRRRKRLVKGGEGSMGESRIRRGSKGQRSLQGSRSMSRDKGRGVEWSERGGGGRGKEEKGGSVSEGRLVWLVGRGKGVIEEVKAITVVKEGIGKVRQGSVREYVRSARSRIMGQELGEEVDGGIGDKGAEKTEENVERKQAVVKLEGNEKGVGSRSLRRDKIELTGHARIQWEFCGRRSRIKGRMIDEDEIGEGGQVQEGVEVSESYKEYEET